MTIRVLRALLKSVNSWKLPQRLGSDMRISRLCLALGKPISPYIEITLSEYEQIKNLVYMVTIQIKVADYYGNPSYYSVMPREVFDALEIAALKGEEFATVDKTRFDIMIEQYNIKTQ